TGPAHGTFEDGIEDYKVLKDKCPPTGEACGTAYAFCDGEWWGYDTPDTISGKMGFARDEGLAGAFFWELSGDTSDGELISAIHDGLPNRSVTTRNRGKRRQRLVLTRCNQDQWG